MKESDIVDRISMDFISSSAPVHGKGIEGLKSQIRNTMNRVKPRDEDSGSGSSIESGHGKLQGTKTPLQSKKYLIKHPGSKYSELDLIKTEYRNK